MSLKENGFITHYVPDKKETIAKTLSMTPEDTLVGLGESVILREMNLPELIKERGNTVRARTKRNFSNSDSRGREIRILTNGIIISPKFQ